MKLTKLATTGVALLASAALVFGGASAANAAYPPATGISVSGASAGAAGASVTYTVKTTKSGRVSGETVQTTLNGKSNTTYFNTAGIAKVTVKYPALAGKYSVVFSAFGKTASKTITVGKAVALSLSATDTKTINSLFTGVTGKGARSRSRLRTPRVLSPAPRSSRTPRPASTSTATRVRPSTEPTPSRPSTFRPRSTSVLRRRPSRSKRTSLRQLSN